MYAIVDIETTGGYASANGITELAIHVFDGSQVVKKFETLINPRQPIPGYIQSFTGITDEMVANAPEFDVVAEEVFNILNEKVFIAHNVNFDYSFIKSHLLKSGLDLKSKKLCTVRLSRKIFPGFPSYSLGNLCRSLEIEINNRHRAGGDAEATVKIFTKLLENDKEDFISKSLQRNSKEQSLPPNVPKGHFDALPTTPGVYYFHDVKGKIIYVGKAINIRSRVNSHFSNNAETRQKQNFITHIHSISFRSCATELMASILESVEIKKYWPKFNYSQKHWEDVFGIYSYEDRNGYLRLAIEKNKKNLKPVHTFHNLSEGYSWLRNVIEEYKLCPKLCFLEKVNGACTAAENKSCKGACIKQESKSSYNKRVKKAIKEMNDETSFAIIDKGLEETQLSCVLVDKGKFFGMGYLPSEYKLTNIDEVKEYLTSYRGNNYIRNLLTGHKEKFPTAIIDLTGSNNHDIKRKKA
ncbi:MAG TPA: exonuclease domain-containing protein [Chitinophagaceae bacterium]|nr:exonuclease domain-containing protein [Chitinophagaceae bacterium]